MGTSFRRVLLQQENTRQDISPYRQHITDEWQRMEAASDTDTVLLPSLLPLPYRYRGEQQTQELSRKSIPPAVSSPHRSITIPTANKQTGTTFRQVRAAYRGLHTTSSTAPTTIVPNVGSTMNAPMGFNTSSNMGSPMVPNRPSSSPPRLQAPYQQPRPTRLTRYNDIAGPVRPPHKKQNKPSSKRTKAQKQPVGKLGHRVRVGGKTLIALGTFSFATLVVWRIFSQNFTYLLVILLIQLILLSNMLGGTLGQYYRVGLEKLKTTLSLRAVQEITEAPHALKDLRHEHLRSLQSDTTAYLKALRVTFSSPEQETMQPGKEQTRS